MPTPRALSGDTHPKIEELRLDVFRRLPVWRKLELVEDANRTARLLALSGLRARHPNASDAEIERRLMDLLLGPEMARRAFGPLTDDDGNAANGDA